MVFSWTRYVRLSVTSVTFCSRCWITSSTVSRVYLADAAAFRTTCCMVLAKCWTSRHKCALYWPNYQFRLNDSTWPNNGVAFGGEPSIVALLVSCAFSQSRYSTTKAFVHCKYLLLNCRIKCHTVAILIVYGWDWVSLLLLGSAAFVSLTL